MRRCEGIRVCGPAGKTGSTDGEDRSSCTESDDDRHEAIVQAGFLILWSEESKRVCGGWLATASMTMTGDMIDGGIDEMAEMGDY